MRNERDKILKYKERRDARLAKRGLRSENDRMDSVEAFYERRNGRRSGKNLPKIKFNQSSKKVDTRNDVWYNKEGGQNRLDAGDVIDGEKVEWKTSENGKRYAINSEGNVVAGPKAMKGKSISEVKKEAAEKSKKKPEKKAEAPKTAPADEHPNRPKADSISSAFAKKRGFKKEAPTFSQSIMEALDHGMTEEKINQVLDNLTEDDIYEINGESGVIGLASKIDDQVVGKSDECQKIWEKAKVNGTPITNDVVDITKSLGASMSGLEFAVKAGKSSSEKIDREHEDHKKETGKDDSRSDEQILSELKDVVRFTQFSPHEKLAENASKTIKMLENKGYEIMACKNRYASPKQEEYYDIKIVAKNPEGQLFELQFHSKESLDVKNKNHGLYEKQRAVGVSDEEKARLGAEMMKNSASLSKPSGYEKIPNFDKFKGGKNLNG